MALYDKSGVATYQIRSNKIRLLLTVIRYWEQLTGFLRRGLYPTQKKNTPLDWVPDKARWNWKDASGFDRLGSRRRRQLASSPGPQSAHISPRRTPRSRTWPLDRPHWTRRFRQPLPPHVRHQSTCWYMRSWARCFLVDRERRSVPASSQKISSVEVDLSRSKWTMTS